MTEHDMVERGSPPALKSRPIGGLSPKARLERYSALFNFENVEDVDTLGLAEQWNVHRLGVSGMISAAKNSKNLYKEMISFGYADDEFPAWWYSPARDTQVQQSADLSADVQTSNAKSPKSTFKPILPRNPTHRADSPGRPPVLPQDSTAHDSSPSDTPRHEGTRGTSQFSESDLTFLAEQQITEVIPGRWMHTSERGDGSIILTPVDPRQELLNMRREEKGDRIMGTFGEQMFQQLSVHTQAITKKVAFNPSVFQCWQFVANSFDEDTGDPFLPPSWDFGDYVSHCVLWTTEHEYGVVPTVLYNRPSRYTRLREMRRARDRGDSIPLSDLNLPRSDEGRVQ